MCELLEITGLVMYWFIIISNLPVYGLGEVVVGSNPESGTFPGEGHGSPLQYFCLENSMDRGAWWLHSTGWQRVRHDKGLSTYALNSYQYKHTEKQL